MSRGARQKGYLKNLSTNALCQFMYNPSEITTDRSVNWSEINSPGSSYPIFVYTGGSSISFPLSLTLEGSNAIIEEKISFIKNLLPKEDSSSFYNKPPMFLVVMGKLCYTCIATSYSEASTMFDPKNLARTFVTVNLECKVVK